jgi:hypothetical protein
VIPIAHAGHVVVDLIVYGAPVVIALGAIMWADRRERAKDDEDEAREA